LERRSSYSKYSACLWTWLQRREASLSRVIFRRGMEVRTVIVAVMRGAREVSARTVRPVDVSGLVPERIVLETQALEETVAAGLVGDQTSPPNNPHFVTLFVKGHWSRRRRWRSVAL
jgi:hypothetical protein